jgi:carnitine O-acetyltransferase
MSSATAAVVSAAGAKPPLYAQQDELPALPLPSLAETFEKLLKSVRPLATDEEFEHTESVVRDFEAGVGAKLQAMLEERAADSRNWLEDWWLEFIYLRPRWPIAVWINYLGASLGNDIVPYTMTQVQAAAIMTVHVLKFRTLVVTETLKPETLAGRPLCMDQYSRMFNSCRVPGEESDSIEVFPHDQKHIIVLRNNSLFKVDVVKDDGSTMDISDLLQAFEDCVRISSTPFDIDLKVPTSVLTSEERNVWAKVCKLSVCPVNVKHEQTTNVCRLASISSNWTLTMHA